MSRPITDPLTAASALALASFGCSASVREYAVNILIQCSAMVQVCSVAQEGISGARSGDCCLLRRLRRSDFFARRYLLLGYNFAVMR